MKTGMNGNDMDSNLDSGPSSTGSSLPVEIEIQLGSIHNHRHRHSHGEKCDDKPKSALVKDAKAKKEASLADFGKYPSYSG
jgi:hypothetical protein